MFLRKIGYHKTLIAFKIILISLLMVTCIPEPDFDFDFQEYDFSAVDELIDRNAGVFRDNVTVFVLRNDVPVYFTERGNIGPGLTIPVGSASALVSAAVLLKMWEQGYFALDDSVGTYLPALTAHGMGHITIRQLVANTAGFDQTPDPNDPFLGEGYVSLEAAVLDMAEQVPLAYEPGTVFHYGERSMQIAGLIAEQLTGLNWFQVFRDKIGTPCEMIFSDYGMGGNFRIASGLRTTLFDYMNFLRMISNNGFCSGTRVLRPETIQEFYRDQTGGAPIAYSPFPNSPAFAYAGTDTIRYGFGNWLDVVNPANRQVEQISSPGEFGTYPWVDRTRGLTGIIITLSSWEETAALQFDIIQEIRMAVDEFDTR